MSKNTQLNPYDELAARRNAAYVAFSSMYALQNPQPDKPRLPVEDGLTIFQLLILLVATVIVSASRTFSEFGEVGGAAVVMLELGVISYAFIHTSLYYNARRPETLKRLLALGMALAFVVLLTANIDKVLRGAGVEMDETVKTFFNLVLAISAPTLAFITGDLLGVYVTKAFRQWKKDKAKYDSAQADWRGDLNEAFKVYAPRLNATIKVEKETPSLPVSPDFTKLHENTGEIDVSPKRRVKLHEVAREIHENGDGNLSTADMVEKYRISLGSTTKVRDMLKSMNGHGENHG